MTRLHVLVASAFVLVGVVLYQQFYNPSSTATVWIWSGLFGVSLTLGFVNWLDARRTLYAVTHNHLTQIDVEIAKSHVQREMFNIVISASALGVGIASVSRWSPLVLPLFFLMAIAIMDSSLFGHIVRRELYSRIRSRTDRSNAITAQEEAMDDREALADIRDHDADERDAKADQRDRDR